MVAIVSCVTAGLSGRSSAKAAATTPTARPASMFFISCPGFRLEGFDLVHFQLRSNDFAIRRDANMLADIRQCCAPNYLNCGMRKIIMRYLLWHFSSAVQSLPRRHKTTGQDQTPPITMFRAIQPAAETTSRRIIRRTRTAVQAITTALKAITTPTTGRQAEATEESSAGVAHHARLQGRSKGCAAFSHRRTSSALSGESGAG